MFFANLFNLLRPKRVSQEFDPAEFHKILSVAEQQIKQINQINQIKADASKYIIDKLGLRTDPLESIFFVL